MNDNEPTPFRPGPRPKPRYQTSLQMTFPTRDKVCLLGERLAVSQAAVVEMAVRNLAQKMLPSALYQKLISQGD